MACIFFLPYKIFTFSVTGLSSVSFPDNVMLRWELISPYLAVCDMLFLSLQTKKPFTEQRDDDCAGNRTFYQKNSCSFITLQGDFRGITLT